VSPLGDQSIPTKKNLIIATYMHTYNTKHLHHRQENRYLNNFLRSVIFLGLLELTDNPEEGSELSQDLEQGDT